MPHCKFVIYSRRTPTKDLCCSRKRCSLCRCCNLCQNAPLFDSLSFNFLSLTHALEIRANLNPSTLMSALGILVFPAIMIMVASLNLIGFLAIFLRCKSGPKLGVPTFRMQCFQNFELFLCAGTVSSYVNVVYETQSARGVVGINRCGRR